MHSFYGCGCKSEVYLLYHMLQDIMGSVSATQFLFSQENQIPYGLLLSETDQKALFMAYLKCYEFYELGQVHLCLGRVELM